MQQVECGEWKASSIITFSLQWSGKSMRDQITTVKEKIMITLLQVIQDLKPTMSIL